MNRCFFMGTDNGLRFKSIRDRGGVAENSYICKIKMMGIQGEAINFNPFYAGKPPLDDTYTRVETNFQAVTEETPRFRDIHIEKVVGRDAKNAIVLQGLPEMLLRDITLENVSIMSQNGVSVTDTDKILFENVRVENQSGVPLKTFRVKDSKLELLKSTGTHAASPILISAYEQVQ